MLNIFFGHTLSMFRLIFNIHSIGISNVLRALHSIRVKKGGGGEGFVHIPLTGLHVSIFSIGVYNLVHQR